MNNEQLEENLKLLKEYVEKGKIKFAKHLSVISSLEKVKYLSNGKIDLSTVDSVVRALANSIAMLEYRKQLKSISLRDIQKNILKCLELFLKILINKWLKIM